MPSSYLVSKLNAERTKKSIYKLVAEDSFEDINVGDEIETTEEIQSMQRTITEHCKIMIKIMMMNKRFLFIP